MADQETPEGVETTGADTPEGTGEEVNWQERYEHLQPEFTRASQEAAQLRQQVAQYDDPDYQAQLLAQWGYEVQDGDDQEFVEPTEALARQVAEVQQYLQWQAQTQEEQQRGNEVRAIVDAQLQKLGLDEEDGNDVLAYAIHALPPTQEGIPDVQTAYQRFKERQEAREKAAQKAWRDSKRAPHMSPVGTAGTQTPNLDNRQERQDWMVEQFMANET